MFNNVAAIETPDDLTVVIKMSAVNAPFLSRLAENGAGVIMPVDSGPTQGTTPMGAGPFKFVSYTSGIVVEMARFDDYWDGPAYLDKIIDPRDHREHDPPDRPPTGELAHDQRHPGRPRGRDRGRRQPCRS